MLVKWPVKAVLWYAEVSKRPLLHSTRISRKGSVRFDLNSHVKLDILMLTI
jgi:hypothetical protein